MTKCKAVSKKVRFEIFKRDRFTCAYCGNTPPSVVLEIDHIDPVSKGGDNSETNLITACFDCNRGKRDIPINSIPQSLSESIEILKERELQIGEYRKFKRSVSKRENKDIKRIEEIFRETFNNFTLTKKFKKQTLLKFVRSLPLDEIEDSMWLATSKMWFDQERCIRYFCGICWRKIKDNGRY